MQHAMQCYKHLLTSSKLVGLSNSGKTCGEEAVTEELGAKPLEMILVKSGYYQSNPCTRRVPTNFGWRQP